MKRKITKEQIQLNPSNYTFNQYDHGGSRIFIDGKSGERQLLVDTYYTQDFADYINAATRAYFNLPSSKPLSDIGNSLVPKEGKVCERCNGWGKVMVMDGRGGVGLDTCPNCNGTSSKRL